MKKSIAEMLLDKQNLSEHFANGCVNPNKQCCECPYNWICIREENVIKLQEKMKGVDNNE